jgi:hypothetical protein
VLIEANTFKKDALKQCKVERERERERESLASGF